jgi:drug/metabolite transporter (DMT)-like permease
MEIPKQFRLVTGVRSLLQQLSQMVNLLVIVMLPLGTMQIVQNTQAFWTTIFGYLVNQENFLKIELIGIFACFCGVIMMANPPTEDIGIVHGSSDQNFD